MSYQSRKRTSSIPFLTMVLVLLTIATVTVFAIKLASPAPSPTPYPGTAQQTPNPPESGKESQSDTVSPGGESTAHGTTAPDTNPSTTKEPDAPPPVTYTDVTLLSAGDIMFHNANVLSGLQADGSYSYLNVFG